LAVRELPGPASGPGRGSGPIRPVARALLRRWAEPVAAGALAALCLWLGAGRLAAAGALGGWLGWPLLALGAAFALWFWAALQRARMTGGDALGPGVVRIQERRIAYFGPYEGGVIALDSLVGIAIESGPAPVWRLRLDDGRVLRVPAAAEGAAALPEAFAALDGFSSARAAAALATRGRATFPIWRR
jgi:hypothetical protein